MPSFTWKVAGPLLVAETTWIGLTETACTIGHISREIRVKASAGMARSQLGRQRAVGRLLSQTTLLPQFPVVLLTPDAPHGWESGTDTCCVSHDQTLFAIGTWWARQIEGIQVKVEARRLGKRWRD